MRALVAILLVSVQPSCSTWSVREPAGGSMAFVARADARRAWQVVDGDRCIGAVVRFEERDGARCWFSVRNEFGQELGLVDSQGRAWRRHAHEPEAECLGSSTLAEAARRVLGASTSATLVELDLAATAAASSTRDR